MAEVKNVYIILLVFTFLLPLDSLAARWSEPEELERLINKINERQSKNIKNFEKKAKAYFFETQKPEVIDFLIKEFSPGDAVVAIVLSNFSKKSYKDITAMRKAGKGWPDIANQLSVRLKDVVKEVKDFRSGIG